MGGTHASECEAVADDKQLQFRHCENTGQGTSTDHKGTPDGRVKKKLENTSYIVGCNAGRPEFQLLFNSKTTKMTSCAGWSLPRIDTNLENSNFNPKISAKQLVKNILRTFWLSSGAIFNAYNVQLRTETFAVCFSQVVGCYFSINDTNLM